MTRSLGSVRSIFNTLCLVCAWLVPTKKYLCQDTTQKEMQTQFIVDYKHDMNECKIVSVTFGHIQIV